MVRKIQVALDQQDALEQRRELENGVKIDQHQFEKALEEDEETEDWSSDSAQLKTKAIEAIGDSDATGRRKETRDAVVPENARADKQGPQQRGCRETASTAMQENFVCIFESKPSISALTLEKKNSSKPLVGGVAHCPTAAINESLKAQKKGGNVVDEHVPCLYGSHIQTRVTETGRPVFRALKREEIEERNKLLKGQKCYCEACTKRDVESQKERAKGMWVEDHGNVRGL